MSHVSNNNIQTIMLKCLYSISAQISLSLGLLIKVFSKVRDHCHLSGKFRGAAHNKCNLNYKLPKFYPVVFHNLSGYDSHLFIKKL